MMTKFHDIPMSSGRERGPAPNRSLFKPVPCKGNLNIWLACLPAPDLRPAVYSGYKNNKALALELHLMSVCIAFFGIGLGVN